jgi:hypothetical protein
MNTIIFLPEIETVPLPSQAAEEMLMRLLIASVAAFAAVAFAAPSFAQEAAPAPAPAPVAKPKPRTTAYCNTLKSSASKSSCLKRVHANGKASSSRKAQTKTKKADPAKTATSAQLTPSAAMPVQAPSTSQTVAIPPLPQKTI